MEKGIGKMKAVIYANTLKEVNECMKYAEAKGYQVIALKNEKHDIVGEAEMDVLLFATSSPKNRSYEDLLLIEKYQHWYDVELVVVR